MCVIDKTGKKKVFLEELICECGSDEICLSAYPKQCYVSNKKRGYVAYGHITCAVCGKELLTVIM